MTRIIILPLNSEDQQPGYHMHVDDVDLIDCVEREAVDNRMNAIVVHPANEESAKALHRFARAQARRGVSVSLPVSEDMAGTIVTRDQFEESVSVGEYYPAAYLAFPCDGKTYSPHLSAYKHGDDEAFVYVEPQYGHEGGFLQTFTSKDHYIDTLADALGDDRETAIAFHEFLERDGFPTTNDRGEWFAVWNALDSADWQKLLERFERGV